VAPHYLEQDLLGQSMAVSFSLWPGGNQTPILVYSHIDPAPGLAPGDKILQGQLIGQTFDARQKKSRLLSHLHLSCVLIAGTINETFLDWTLFSNRDKVTYVNPIFL